MNKTRKSDRARKAFLGLEGFLASLAKLTTKPFVACGTLFRRKPKVPKCQWCGSTDNLTPVNATDFGNVNPILVCLDIAKCNERYHSSYLSIRDSLIF